MKTQPQINHLEEHQRFCVNSVSTSICLFNIPQGYFKKVTCRYRQL